jgi:uroporphyrinogen-III synthase
MPPSSRAGQPLAGIGVAVTRPAHQAGALAQKLEDAGANVIRFPTIEIAVPEDLRPFYQVLDQLKDHDIAVFVSPNAVARAMDLICARGALPGHLLVAAIGDSTVSALRQRGVREVIAPEHSFDSEALMALPALRDVAGKRVVIFRGEGGRELLGDTLAARGAHVVYAECYRRVVPHIDTKRLFDAWARDALQAFVVTSSIGLRNLASMIGERGMPMLAATAMFVSHPRIAENARGLGISRVIVTAAGDDGIVAGISAHFKREP